MSRSVPEWIGRTDDSMPSSTVRDRIARRQNDQCANCGRTFGVALVRHCDHIVPLRDGGENREGNLQMLCAKCHSDKTRGEAGLRAKVTALRTKFSEPIQRRHQWPKRPLGNGNQQHTATRAMRPAVGLSED